VRKDGEYWFEPKWYGYGVGWPIAIQGWLVLAGYIAVLALCGALVEWDTSIGRLAAAFIFVPATTGLVMICKVRTRGGWRWRWGERD
jgi:hypothetical protein